MIARHSMRRGNVGGGSVSRPTSRLMGAAVSCMILLAGCAGMGTPAGTAAFRPVADWCTETVPDSALAGAGYSQAEFGVAAPAKAAATATAPTGVQCFWTTSSGNISVGRLDFAAQADAVKYMGDLVDSIGPVTPTESGRQVDGFDEMRSHLTPMGVYSLYLRKDSTIYRGGVNGCAEESACDDSIAGVMILASKAEGPALPATCAAAKGDAAKGEEFNLVILSNSDEMTTYFGLVGEDGKAAYVVHDSKAAENLGFVAVAEPVTSSETTPAGPTSINGIPVDLAGQHLDGSGFWLEKDWAIPLESGKAILAFASNSDDATTPFVPGSMVVTDGEACLLFDA